MTALTTFSVLQDDLERESKDEVIDVCDHSGSSSDEQSCTTSAAQKDAVHEHVYANLKEIEELNNRAVPPTPGPDDQPKRNLNNGWMEYETEIGRTYFFNRETGKSQWIPPRFLRTPAEVQAILDATRSEMEDHSLLSMPRLSESESVSPESPVSDVNANSEEEYVYLVDTKTQPLPMSTFCTPKADPPMTNSQSALVIRKNSGENNNYGRAQSFKMTRPPQLKNIPVPQVLPTTSYAGDNELQTAPKGSPVFEAEQISAMKVERRGSGESREPVRTVRCGTMEKVVCDGTDAVKNKKKEWQSNFLYLTTAHLILYKDGKAAEKHDNHYAAPLGVCDLRGATVSWIAQKDKKKRRIIQLDLVYGPRYLWRSVNDSDTLEWFEALRDVIAKLPAIPASHGLPLHSSILDGSCALVRNPSSISQRPHSTTLPSSHRSSKKSNDMMSQSAIQPTTQEEARISRETILERLIRFFRNRPTVESLKEKGIYKPEPVFGSTLANISQMENSLVPKFLRTVIELIENKGLNVDGLYRVSGNLSAVQKIRCQVDQDKYNTLVNEEDVHVLTGALKLFFRELAEPLFPLNCHKEYLNAIKIQNAKQKLKKFDELLKTLPQENTETLKMLLRHLHRVAAHSDKNRMQAHNLAIMFGPTLFHNGEEKPKKSVGKKAKKENKKEDPPPIQSNSHLAFNMIMQGQIVEWLLNEHSKFEALQGPILTHPP